MFLMRLTASDCCQNPAEETSGKKPEFAHVIPKLTLHEKYFLTQLLTVPAKDVSYCCIPASLKL